MCAFRLCNYLHIYEGMVLEWFPFVPILMISMDTVFIIATVFNLIYFRKTKLLLALNIFSAVLIVTALASKAAGWEHPAALATVWFFYIFFYYYTMVVKQTWKLEQTRKDIKDLSFGKRASKYDGFEGKMSHRFYRLLLEQVKLFPNVKVLDVGCGTGTILYKMNETCTIDGYGIDMAENMIAEAKRKCPDMNIQTAKCEDTPFEKQFFDVITACMAYHHFSDRAGFAREAARILKPGGCLYIADPRFPFIIRKTMNGIFRLFNVAGCFNTPQELYDQFSNHGFIPDGFVVDGYAQVVKLKRRSE